MCRGGVQGKPSGRRSGCWLPEASWATRASFAAVCRSPQPSPHSHSHHPPPFSASPVVVRAIALFGCEFFLSYGMTECCGKISMSILPAGAPQRMPGGRLAGEMGQRKWQDREECVLLAAYVRTAGDSVQLDSRAGLTPIHTYHQPIPCSRGAAGAGDHQRPAL